MSKSLFSSVIFASLLFMFPAGLCAQQYSARQLAALIEEVTALRDEVNRLRMDVEDLRAENARLEEKLGNRKQTPNGAAEIAALRVEINNKLEAQRREIAASVDKRLAEVVANTNAALKEMRDQVNKALAGVGAGAPVKPSTPLKEPKDLPAKGIQYKVKSGDTLSKIAREQRSKIAWILYVNPGLDANRLPLGKEIVIPQAD